MAALTLGLDSDTSNAATSKHGLNVVHLLGDGQTLCGRNLDGMALCDVDLEVWAEHSARCKQCQRLHQRTT
jgi:hypothetical protein